MYLYDNILIRLILTGSLQVRETVLRNLSFPSAAQAQIAINLAYI